MGFRALFRGATSSAIPKEMKLDLSTEDIGSLAEGSEYRGSRSKVKSLRGSWGKQAGANLATSSTASSSYPMMTIDAFTPNVELNLIDLGQGMGASLWVTDANNWWGVSTYQQSETCGCQTCSSTSCDTCTGTNYVSASCPRYGCTDRAPNGYCRAYGTWYYDCSYTTSFNYSCNCSTYYYSCNCSTCYPQYIRILQSVGGSVSAIASWTFNTVIRALKVKTLNKQISVDNYSDVSQANLIANVTYNATSATETTNFGIMASPSSYNESKTLGSINIRRNR